MLREGESGCSAAAAAAAAAVGPCRTRGAAGATACNLLRPVSVLGLFVSVLQDTGAAAGTPCSSWLHVCGVLGAVLRLLVVLVCPAAAWAWVHALQLFVSTTPYFE